MRATAFPSPTYQTGAHQPFRPELLPPQNIPPTEHFRPHNYLQRTEKRTEKREEYTKQLK